MPLEFFLLSNFCIELCLDILFWLSSALELNFMLRITLFEIGSMVHLEKIVLCLFNRLALGLLGLFAGLRLIKNRVADRLIAKHRIIAFIWFLLFFLIECTAKSTHFFGLFLQLLLLGPETPFFSPYLLKGLPFLVNAILPLFFFDVYHVWGLQVDICASKGRRRRTIVINITHRQFLFVDFLEFAVSI